MRCFGRVPGIEVCCIRLQTVNPVLGFGCVWPAGMLTKISLIAFHRICLGGQFPSTGLGSDFLSGRFSGRLSSVLDLFYTVTRLFDILAFGPFFYILFIARNRIALLRACPSLVVISRDFCLRIIGMFTFRESFQIFAVACKRVFFERLNPSCIICPDLLYRLFGLLLLRDFRDRQIARHNNFRHQPDSAR